MSILRIPILAEADMGVILKRLHNGIQQGVIFFFERKNIYLAKSGAHFLGAIGKMVSDPIKNFSDRDLK